MSLHRRPVQVTRPGEFVANEMQARGWSMFDLVDRSGLSPVVLGAVLAGKEQINVHIACGLSRAFGTSVRLWLSLQQAYDEWGTVE